MSIHFPYKTKPSFFGEIPDPKIPILVWTREGYRTFRFLVDTGADATLLPRFAADYIGVDLSKSPRIEVQGVEGGGLRAYAGWIQVKIRWEGVRDSLCFCRERLSAFYSWQD